VTRTIRIIQEASAEFTDAVRWYEERRPGLGGEFFDAVSMTIEFVAAGPEIGAALSAGGGERRLLVPRFPYQVVYRLTSSDVVIVALAHLRRRPGYWKNRP
jgi:toxin ParE1/3/4